jgi:hypothetical protein
LAQEKYFRLTHFVPKGHPQVYPGISSEVKAMMPYLIERVPKGWTFIPGHDQLEVFATRNKDVPLLGFKKNKVEVYLHVFCNEFINPIYAMEAVFNLYIEYRLGKPAFQPEELNWVHSIPLPGANLDPVESMLMFQLTQSLFWAIYMDYKRRR